MAPSLRDRFIYLFFFKKKRKNTETTWNIFCMLLSDRPKRTVLKFVGRKREKKKPQENTKSWSKLLLLKLMLSRCHCHTAIKFSRSFWCHYCERTNGSGGATECVRNNNKIGIIKANTRFHFTSTRPGFGFDTWLHFPHFIRHISAFPNATESP